MKTYLPYALVDKKMRNLKIILIVILTLYAPLELTKVIFNWWYLYGELMEWRFIFEIAFIWICYFGAIYLIFKEVK